MRRRPILERLSIEPSETSVVVWAAATLFLIGAVDVTVRNASETFFLKRVGVALLPVAFLLNSLLLVGSTYVFGRLLTGRDRLRVLPAVLVALGVLLLPLWLLVRTELASGFWLLVIASKQITSIALVVFWVAMGDLLHARQAKRLFAPLMAALTLGNIVGSFSSNPLSDLLGIDGLVPFAAGLLAAAALVAISLRRQRSARLERSLARGAREPLSAGIESVPALGPLWRESGLFRLLFVPALCSGLLGPMLYFQFQYVVNLSTPAGEVGEQPLLEFYAQFRGWISVGVLIAQLAITSRLYRRLGVPLAAALSPLVYLLGFVGLSLRLSLPAGVGASAGTKLSDNAVYDPALRILFNLFPEARRAGVTSLLEGPVKRAGGAVGNLASYAANALGSAAWVGYTALPIAGVWLAAAFLLWRAYPALLLRASAGPGRLDTQELVDPATLRALSPQLIDPDPERCALAIELVCEARPELAVGALARAASEAPDATRPLLVAALDQVLESGLVHHVANREAAAALASLLGSPGKLQVRDRADAVQAIGRLTRDLPDAGEAVAVLERALEDPAPAVRTAAAAALCRRGQPPPGLDLDRLLGEAAASEDALTRRVAREELRAALLMGDPDESWGARLTRLAGLLSEPEGRAFAAEAVADVAGRQGAHAAIAAEAMLHLRDDPDPRVRAAVLRFAGRAGLQTEARWMIEHVASDGFAGAEQVRSAACDALKALGPNAADVLLVELGCGKRSTRDAILPIVRQLSVESEALRTLYGRELESVRRSMVNRAALQDVERAGIVAQRLEERIGEGVHTALLLLAAIREEDRIAELGELLLRADGRQRSILIEALEALLGAQEKQNLLPLLEERPFDRRGRSAAADLGIPIPSYDQVRRLLLEDPDDLTRALAQVSFDGGGPPGADLAAARDLEDDSGVLSPVEVMLHLRSLPIFEHLTTRQLMDLAKVVSEESHASGQVVVREDDSADSMYLIVDGEVEIRKGDRTIRVLGPRSFFGEMAVFEGAPRSATVVTRTPVRLLLLRRQDLFRMMEELPAIAISICRTMSRRVRELTESLNG